MKQGCLYIAAPSSRYAYGFIWTTSACTSDPLSSAFKVEDSVMIPIPTFLRPSFHSSKKKVAAAVHVEGLDDLSRTYRVSKMNDKGEKSHDIVKSRAEDYFTLTRKHQQTIVPAECRGVGENHEAIEVTYSDTSFANKLRRTQRVRFIDVYTASHIVTDTYYRPETTEGEKALLYYCSEDYAQFALEDWQWKLSNEMKRLRDSLS